MFNLKVLAFAALAGSSAFAVPGPASAQVVEGEEHCVVNVKASDVLNVRSKASATSKVVATLKHGDCGIVVTTACQSSWCPVEDGHIAGWVSSRYISVISPAMYCVAGVAAGDVLNVRAFPSTSSRILTKLPRNKCDIAFLPYSTGAWQKIRVSGYEGWINRDFVSGQ